VGLKLEYRDNNKNKKFKKFISIFNGFLLNSKEKEIRVQKENIEKEVDFLIDSENINIVSDYLKAGYIFTTEQKMTIIDKWDIFFDRNYRSRTNFHDAFAKDTEFLEDLFFNQQNLFVRKFKSVLSKMDKNYTGTSMSKMQENSGKFVKPLETSFKLLKEFDSLFASDFQKIQKAILVLSNSKKLIDKNAHWNKYLLPDLSSKTDDVLRRLNDHVNNSFKQDFEHKLQKTHLIYTTLAETVNKNLESNIREKTKNFGPAVIPAQSWNTIKQIEEILPQINKEKLLVNDSWELDNIINEKLPEMIKDYLSISDNYKTKLKTVDGKNADDLLFDSLQEIKLFIGNIFEEQQKSNLLTLSAKKVYFKNKLA
jgi:hypothetical protein